MGEWPQWGPAIPPSRPNVSVSPTCPAIISLDPASRSFSRWLSQPRVTKLGVRKGRSGGMLHPADKKWKSRRPETSYTDFVYLFRLKLKASNRPTRLDFRQLNSRVPLVKMIRFRASRRQRFTSRFPFSKFSQVLHIENVKPASPETFWGARH